MGSMILPLPVMGDAGILLSVIPGLDAFLGPAPRRFVKCPERPGAPAGVMRFGVRVFSEDWWTNVSMPDYRPGFPISDNPDRCRGSSLRSFYDLIS